MGLLKWIDDFFEGMKSNATNRALKKVEKTQLDSRLVKQIKRIKTETMEFNRLMAKHK